MFRSCAGIASLSKMSENGTDGDGIYYYARPNATVGERVSVGLCYCLFSGVFLFLQCSILIIFFSYKDYYMNMCYRIMMVISMVDSVQLVVHFYGGIIAICNFSLNFWLEKILGAILNTFCIALFPLCLVLAVERLFVYLPRRLFHSRHEHWVVGILIGLCFAWAVPFFLAYLTPYTGIVFRSYAWDYDDSTSVKWRFVQSIDESSSMPILAVTFLIYLYILAILIYKRRKQSRSENYSVLIAPHEKRLLIQSLIQFGLELSLNLLWLSQAFCLIPDFPLSEAAIYFYWICFNGVKPILYLIFNTPIRERTFRLWLCQGKEQLQISNDPIADIVLRQQIPPHSSMPSSKISPHINLGRVENNGVMTNPRRSIHIEKEIRFNNGQIQVHSDRPQHVGSRFNQTRASLPHFAAIIRNEEQK